MVSTSHTWTASGRRAFSAWMREGTPYFRSSPRRPTPARFGVNVGSHRRSHPRITSGGRTLSSNISQQNNAYSGPHFIACVLTSTRGTDFNPRLRPAVTQPDHTHRKIDKNSVKTMRVLSQMAFPICTQKTIMNLNRLTCIL